MFTTRSFTTWTRHISCFLAALAVMALCPRPAHAAIIISVQSVSASANSTGNLLDVVLQNTGGSSVTVGSFTFQIATSNTDITFTSASTSVASYIFTGHSAFGPFIELSTGQVLDASDAYDVISSGAVVGAGQTVGLGQISFDIALAAGSGGFSVVLSPGGTSLSDAVGDTITIDTLVDGVITIDGAAVPEPGTALLAAGALLALVLRVRRR